MEAGNRHSKIPAEVYTAARNMGADTIIYFDDRAQKIYIHAENGEIMTKDMKKIRPRPGNKTKW